MKSTLVQQLSVCFRCQDTGTYPELSNAGQWREKRLHKKKKKALGKPISKQVALARQSQLHRALGNSSKWQ